MAILVTRSIEIRLDTSQKWFDWFCLHFTQMPAQSSDLHGVKAARPQPPPFDWRWAWSDKWTAGKAHLLPVPRLHVHAPLPPHPFCHACSPLCSGHFRLATCRLPLRSHALGPLHLTDDFDYFKQLLKAHLFGGGLRLQRLRPVTNIPICKLTFLYFT